MSETWSWAGELKAIRVARSSARADVAEVVLVGPGKGNAMGPDFWREVPEAFERLDADESLRCIVVHGQGGNFSYGLDLMAMMGNLGPMLAGPQMAPERTKLRALVLEMQRSFNRIV